MIGVISLRTRRSRVPYAYVQAQEARTKQQGRDAGRWLYQKTLLNLCHSREKPENFHSFQTGSVLPCFTKIEMYFAKRVVSEKFSWRFSRSISLKLIFRMYLLSYLSLGESILVKYYLCYFHTGRHSCQHSNKFKDFLLSSEMGEVSWPILPPFLNTYSGGSGLTVDLIWASTQWIRYGSTYDKILISSTVILSTGIDHTAHVGG